MVMIMSVEITECLNIYGLEVMGTKSGDEFLWKYQMVPVMSSDHKLTYQIEIEFGSKDETLSDTTCIAYISGHYKKPRGGIEDFELPDMVFSSGFVGAVDRDVRTKILRAIYSDLPTDICALELARPPTYNQHIPFEGSAGYTDLGYSDVGLESGTLMCCEPPEVLSESELTRQKPLMQRIFGGKTGYVDLDTLEEWNSKSGLPVEQYDSLKELSKRNGSRQKGAFDLAFRLGL